MAQATKRKPPERSAESPIAFIPDTELYDLLVAEHRAAEASLGGVSINRSEFLRVLVREALERRRDKRKPRP